MATKKASPTPSASHVVLFTGFPGFIGARLLPRLLELRPNVRFACLVQEKFQSAAREAVEAMATAHPATGGRLDVVIGDITAPGLGLGEGEARRLRKSLVGCVVTLTNNSGGALVAGDVCVQDTAGGNEYATTTTAAASTKQVFIAAESIANAAAGRFYAAGYCPLVRPSASVTRGRYLFTHTVAKQAAENATYGAGAFGVILESGTTPSVWLFGETSQGSGGAGSDTTAIHDNVASEISAVTDKVSPVNADLLLIEDSADSNNKKRVQIGNLPSSGGTDFLVVQVFS